MAWGHTGDLLKFNTDSKSKTLAISIKQDKTDINN